MFTIDFGSLSIAFEAPLISVPAEGGGFDWVHEDWIDIAQDIRVSRVDGGAIITGLTGHFASAGDHHIQILEPALFSEAELIYSLLARACVEGHTEYAVRKAISVSQHAWGKTLCLSWSSLGYAPGGVESFLLPEGGPAISLGYLRFDWDALSIHIG